MIINVPTQHITSFIIEREPYEDDYLTLTVNSNSYSITRTEILKWFLRVRVPNIVHNKLLDTVWNFYKVGYNIETQQLKVF